MQYALQRVDVTTDSEHIKAMIRRAPLLSFHWSLEDLAALAEDLS